MRKTGVIVFLILVLLFSVAASGCTGGGGGITKTSNRESEEEYTETESSGGVTSATWETPWNAYNPIRINGEDYYITYIKYKFTIKTPEGEQSYQVEKRRGYIKTHVYAEENGQKKDLGEFNLFAYYGKITPIEGPENATFEYIIAVKERTNDTDEYFLQPLPNFALLGTGSAVMAEVRSGSGYFYWSNPPAVGQYSELPYTEGSLEDVMNAIGPYIFNGWMAMMGSAAWTGLEGRDLMRKDEYTFSFMGLSYHYKISPDGSVELDDKSFRVSEVEWSYSFGGVNMEGKAEIAPSLPVPVETEGNFVDLSSGTKVYSKLKIEDIKLEKTFGGIDVKIEKPTSAGETEESETETDSGTETQTESQISENWERSWDASEPIKIGDSSYILGGVTYDVRYKTPEGEVHYTMKRGYNKTDDGYVIYAIVKMDDGSTYRFTVYVSPGTIGEYTSGVLWTPSVLQLIESGSPEKVVITGPSCSYTYDESSGEMSGDFSCGAEIRESPFDQIWDLDNGFAGGIYGDVVEVNSLTENGEGYTVQKDGTVAYSGMKFDVYVIEWSGSLLGAIPANGKTAVVPELPIPIEIEASLSGLSGGSLYFHVTLKDVELVRSS